ncbi:MAG: hypothetical protein RIR26_2372 [Pseudomonadota bacterium]
MALLPQHSFWNAHVLRKALLIVFPAFCLPFAAMLAHFLIQGAYYLDSGLFAYLLSEADLPMKFPPVLGEGSYMATHVSPAFWPMQWLAQLFQLKPHVSVAIWQGILFAGMGIAGLIFMERSSAEFSLKQSSWTWCALLLLPFSGLALSILVYPHTEAMAMSALFISFGLILEKNHWAQCASWLLLVFALAVREDAGFHVFGLYMTFLVLSLWAKQLPQQWKKILAAAAVGFVYSVAILKLQKSNFTGDNAFERIYSGNPAWAHVNLIFLSKRLGEFLIHKPYLSIPLVIYSAFTVLQRKWVMLTPVLAYTPWLLVNLAAIAPTAGSLMAYYAYPLLALFIWPLVTLRLEGVALEIKAQRSLVLLCAAMLIVSVLGYRSALGRGLFKWMNPFNLALLWNGTYEEHACAVEKFLGATSGERRMGPQYAALFPGRYSKQEIYFEPEEALSSDYVMLWKDSYFVDKFEKHPSVLARFEKQFEDESANVIWKKRTAAPLASTGEWSSIFARCRKGR